MNTCECVRNRERESPEKQTKETWEKHLYRESEYFASWKTLCWSRRYLNFHILRTERSWKLNSDKTFVHNLIIYQWHLKMLYLGQMTSYLHKNKHKFPVMFLSPEIISSESPLLLFLHFLALLFVTVEVVIRQKVEVIAEILWPRVF